jgi:hypothetical protein
MAATVKIYFDWGGTDGTPGTNTDISGLGPPNVRFKQADNATIDNQDPIPIPAAGTEYSYWKHLYLKVTAGTFTQIDNIRTYSDGTDPWASIQLSIGDQFPTNNSGAPGSGYEVADTTSSMVSAHTGISTPISGPSISEAGGIIDAVNEMSDYTVWQMEVLSTASPGDLTDETFTFKYDEI